MSVSILLIINLKENVKGKKNEGEYDKKEIVMLKEYVWEKYNQLIWLNLKLMFIHT